MNRDGTGVRRLADAADFSRPAWSPDGTKIAFSCAETYNLCLMNPDGSGITEVGISDAFRSDYPCEAHPSWSPDGTRIAFVGECSEFWPSPIVVVDLVTGETTIIAGPIPPDPGPQLRLSLFWPAWRPIS
jgi:Tol biopolymer transport system component